MKHFNLLAIGTLSLLLVGCSCNVGEATPTPSSQMASDDIVTPSTTEHTLSLCVPSSEKGMYTVDSIANGYGNIFYIDFETMQQIPLCDTPNCTHSNDSCTAWLQIDESGFLPGILQLGNSILLVQNGESSNHPACMRTEKTRNCYSVPKADRASALLFIQMKQIRHCILFCQRYPNRRAG